MAVYRNAYSQRLQKALAHDFPALLAALGDTAFGRLTAEYLREYPSSSPSLRDLGRYLALWLRRRGEPLLAELADLEWAVLHAFDAADAPTLTTQALDGIRSQHWPRLRFILHPAVTLLRVNSNSRAFWAAVRQGGPLPALQARAPECLVVWRASKGPAVQAVDPTHYLLLDRLAHGKTFGVGCEALITCEPHRDLPQLAAQALALTLARGWLCALQLEAA